MLADPPSVPPASATDRPMCALFWRCTSPARWCPDRRFRRTEGVMIGSFSRELSALDRQLVALSHGDRTRVREDRTIRFTPGGDATQMVTMGR